MPVGAQVLAGHADALMPPPAAGQENVAPSNAGQARGVRPTMSSCTPVLPLSGQAIAAVCPKAVSAQGVSRYAHSGRNDLKLAKSKVRAWNPVAAVHAVSSLLGPCQNLCVMYSGRGEPARCGAGAAQDLGGCGGHVWQLRGHAAHPREVQPQAGA